ncbi:MAG: 2-oxo acid dehydrogenase subunit E2, partial [Leptolinea sp.]|nr:2-oxo acid dehydrogenase subunit E2 [Leptolinea sp.]
MAETVTMPKLGFDMAEGTLIRWVKTEGESVNKGDILAEIETDKATVEVESSFGGVMYRRLVEQGAIVPVGTPIAIIAAPGERVADEAGESQKIEHKTASANPEPDDNKISPVVKESATNQSESDERIKASPLAKRIAGEFGVSLAGITGSGPGGRIVKKDIEKAVSEIGQARETLTKAASEVKGEINPLPISESWTGTIPARPDERAPLTKLRAAIARRMVDSKDAPHFYITHEYDMAPLMKLRKEMNEFLPDGERFSVNDFIVKAVALTLRQFPNVNASFSGDAIIRHGAVNIGVAVALDSGLMTVVSR